MRKYKIFISGVQKELKEERRAIKKFILEDALQINKVIKRTASRDLAGLVSLGVFKRTGITGKGTLYTLRGHKGDIKSTQKGQMRHS